MHTDHCWAKQEYFLVTGKVNDDDADFSNRMNSFLLWYIFDWRISPTSQSLFDEYLEYLKLKDKENEYNLMQLQKNHLHTLFSFVKIKNNNALIKDLFTL